MTAVEDTCARAEAEAVYWRQRCEDAEMSGFENDIRLAERAAVIAFCVGAATAALIAWVVWAVAA